jgi:pSer/pThr/pTyr-binding forkhead associated (FHA) protein
MAWFRKRLGRDDSDDTATLAVAELALLEGSDRGARLPLRPPELELGRGAETGVRAGRATLRDRSVSLQQARLRREAAGWVLEPIETASNPTLVNGERLAGKRLLAHGDRIQIGRIALEFRSPQRSALREERTEILSLAREPDATVIRPLGEVWGHLVVLQGPSDSEGSRFALTSDRARLGRQTDCDVVLVDPGISRVHAELVREGGRIELYHRSQTNATLLNGAPIGERAELSHGDEIGLADTVLLRLELAGGAADTTFPRGGLRRVMEARVQLEERLEREFVRDGTFLDVDVADSYGLKASESRADRVFVSFTRFRAYVDERVAAARGRVLNSNGDEVMAFFYAADDALACARGLLAGLAEWNGRENLLARAFQVRIGIHTGRSAVDLASGVAYSPVLDIAGHLQKSAPIGGALLSDATRAALTRESADLQPGAALARDHINTWVLPPS